MHAYKTRARDLTYKRFMCNVVEWKKAPYSYVVRIRIDNEEKATIMGWFSREQLEKLDLKDWGSDDCYYCLLTEMNPMSTFVILLLAAKLKPLKA